jgi:hypothetical protein
VIAAEYNLITNFVNDKCGKSGFLSNLKGYNFRRTSSDLKEWF